MTEKIFHSGFVSVVGRPNAGKSTLMNYLLGQKVAAVSPRPQTTQRNQLGIITTDTYQVIFIDTPGIHSPQSKLGELMNDAAVGTIQDVDYVLWIVDSSEKPTNEDRAIAQKLIRANLANPVILALNKIDQVKAEAALTAAEQAFLDLIPNALPFRISAWKGAGCEALLDSIVKILPEGPAFYDAEQITDLYEREIARDLIRESLLKNLDEEIPHSIGVRIDEYKDRTETNSFIMATLILDRETHKSIVLGKGGAMIRKIGQDARLEIEKLTGRKVYLELRVKVVKNWRNNPEILRSLGFEHRKKDR